MSEFGRMFCHTHPGSPLQVVMSTTTDQDKPSTNPLADERPDDASESALVRAAVQGDRRALECLVRRHQGFIYSLAQRMLYAPEDAADATQEILISVVTNLASYRGEAKFRTWAYRIAVRQLLAFKKGHVEQVVHDFDCFGRTLDATPDLDPPDEGSLPVDFSSTPG